jgi:hypothetical protein
VTVTNNGTGNVSPTLAGPAVPFVLTNDNCSGQTVTSGANCSTGVQFSPFGLPAGDYSDRLDVSTQQDMSVVETVYLTARVLTDDANRPQDFSLNSPLEGDMITFPQIFVWDSSADPDLPLTYDIFFCQNTNFVGCPDPAISGIANTPSTVQTNVDIANIPFPVSSGETLFWKVVADDADGDRTDSTDTRSFTVVP